MLSSILNRSMKGAVTGSLCTAPVDSLFFQPKVRKSEMVEQIANIVEHIKFTRKTLSKPLYDRSNDRLFSQRILSIAFHQQKVSKTEIIKPIGAGTNEIYQ